MRTDVATLEVGAADLGKVLGLSERRIRELRDQGTIPGLFNGRFLLAEAAAAYCAHIRPSTGRDAAGGADAAPRLDDARIRLLEEQIEGQAMKNAMARADLLSKAELEAVVGAVLDATRAKVLALPTTAAPRLMGMTTLARIRDTLTDLVHAALADLAGTDAVVADVIDRVQRSLGAGEPDEAPPAEDGAPT